MDIAVQGKNLLKAIDVDPSCYRQEYGPNVEHCTCINGFKSAIQRFETSVISSAHRFLAPKWCENRVFPICQVALGATFVVPTS